MFRIIPVMHQEYDTIMDSAPKYSLALHIIYLLSLKNTELKFIQLKMLPEHYSPHLTVKPKVAWRLAESNKHTVPSNGYGCILNFGLNKK